MQGWSSLLETLQTSNYVVVVVEVVSSSKSLLLYPLSFSGINPWFIMCCVFTSCLLLQMFKHLKSLFGNEDTAHIYSKSHQFDHMGLARLILTCHIRDNDFQVNICDIIVLFSSKSFSSILLKAVISCRIDNCGVAKWILGNWFLTFYLRQLFKCRS